jgi:hypothetical protein
MNFVIGLLIGCAVGIFVFALFAMASRADDGLESLERNWPEKPR